MEEFASCLKCHQQTTDLTAKFCVLCGGKMQSSLRVRKLGWISVFAGGFLVVMTAAIALWLQFSDVTFEGNPELARHLITEGLLILIIGVVGICAGVWQIKHGTRHKVLTSVLVGLGSVLMGLMFSHEFKNMLP